MTCLLPLIAGICLAQPSDLYIGGELQPVAINAPWHEGLTRYDAHSPAPWGAPEIGMGRVTGRWAIEYGYRHDSSIPVNDQGRDVLFLRVRFRPFGGY